MWDKRFDDEVSQFAGGVAHLLVFAHAFVDPLFNLGEVLVDGNQS